MKVIKRSSASWQVLTLVDFSISISCRKPPQKLLKFLLRSRVLELKCVASKYRSGIHGKTMKTTSIKLTVAVFSILLLALGTPLAYAVPNPKPINPFPSPLPAKGTGYDTSFIITSVKTVGVKTVYGVTGSGIVDGDFTGTYTFDGTITIDPSGKATYRVIDVCQCTFVGKSGTVTVQESGGGVPGGQFTAGLIIIDASNDLFGLSGKGKLQGTQDPVTLLTSWSYSMSVTLGS